MPAGSSGSTTSAFSTGPQPFPGGGQLEQADGTSWMAMYALNMLAIALELAEHDRTYEDIATKFFEHFLGIAHALNSLGLWDEVDGFFYDLLLVPGHQPVPLKVRSAVGLVPLFAVETISFSALRRLPDFSARMRWFARHRPGALRQRVHHRRGGEAGTGRQMLSVLGQERLRRVLARLLDESEFLSPYGIRSMSRFHRDNPVSIDLDGAVHRVDYEPAESTTEMFGGNSNWRGPVWFPINFLVVESLQKYHWFLGDEWKVPFPTGSARELNLAAIAGELSRRLIGIFLPGWRWPAARSMAATTASTSTRHGGTRCHSLSISMGIPVRGWGPASKRAGRRSWPSLSARAAT